MNNQPVIEVLVWIGVLIVAAAALGVVVVAIKKRYDASPGESAETFDLGALRRLHREGRISDEEFERAKSAIIRELGGGRPSGGGGAVGGPEGGAGGGGPAERRAEPGYDLTGEPLPPPGPEPDGSPDRPPGSGDRGPRPPD